MPTGTTFPVQPRVVPIPRVGRRAWGGPIVGAFQFDPKDPISNVGVTRYLWYGAIRVFVRHVRVPDGRYLGGVIMVQLCQNGPVIGRSLGRGLCFGVNGYGLVFQFHSFQGVLVFFVERGLWVSTYRWGTPCHLFVTVRLVMCGLFVCFQPSAFPAW